MLLDDPFTFTVVENATGNAVGTIALMRIDCANGSIEVGNVTFSPAIQRTAISTEAQFLLMNYIFESLGYRRYEWKCDSYNAPSINAAKRLGFQYEGTFRNAVVYNGRSRDTAWFSITDSEWQILRPGYRRWLSPDNFKNGKQVMRLQQVFSSRN
ncbi:GNAT family N-acetyltransferase [Corynebacterium canis]|uniref:GNAT family N-acetyltransferase n=1 Tax=Corynebacterium canis TaxID=679663 RepID=UPI001FE5F94D|nr:GNAT family protein [Corynebacterium canis]